MNIYNTYETENSNRPDTEVRDGGGALEEPYMGVRSAHVRPRNPRTGNGLTGLAVPAQVNETPTNVSLEAEDAKTPGRGSSEDETDPFRSLLIGGEEDSDAHRDTNSSDSSESDTDTSSSEDDKMNEQAKKPIKRANKNVPKPRPGIKMASLNMRGRQKDNKDKLKMVIDWLRINRISILALQETHLMDETIEELNERYSNLKFFGSGLSTSSGGIMFITSDRIGIPKDIKFTTIEKGRSGILCLNYEGQKLNIINVYMPNQKIGRAHV